MEDIYERSMRRARSSGGKSGVASVQVRFIFFRFAIKSLPGSEYAERFVRFSKKLSPFDSFPDAISSLLFCRC